MKKILLILVLIPVVCFPELLKLGTTKVNMLSFDKESDGVLVLVSFVGILPTESGTLAEALFSQEPKNCRPEGVLIASKLRIDFFTKKTIKQGKSQWCGRKTYWNRSLVITEDSYIPFVNGYGLLITLPCKEEWWNDFDFIYDFILTLYIDDTNYYFGGSYERCIHKW